MSYRNNALDSNQAINVPIKKYLFLSVTYADRVKTGMPKCKIFRQQQNPGQRRQDALALPIRVGIDSRLPLSFCYGNRVLLADRRTLCAASRTAFDLD